MPQVELSYTSDISIDCKKLFENIEKRINDIDSSAGVCKSRAFCINNFLHTHCFIKVSMLKKQHRDKAFMQNLLEELQAIVVSYLPKHIYYSIEIDFFGDYYLTTQTD